MVENNSKIKGIIRKTVVKKFQDKYISDVKKLALLGLTDKEIANFFEVEESLLHHWFEKYPEFASAHHSGKLGANGEVIAALYKRAKGFTQRKIKTTIEYRYPKEQLTISELHKKTGKTEFIVKNEQKAKKRITSKQVETVYYPPDVSAIVYWLGNRTKNLDNPWTNQTKVEVTGKGDSELLGGIKTLEDIPLDVQNQLFNQLQIMLNAGNKKQLEDKKIPYQEYLDE